MVAEKQLDMYHTCLLHSRADRALRLVVTRELHQFKLTMMEWLLLATVCHGPPEGMTMTAIAQTLDVTLPQVTALTASLTRQRLVRQKIGSRDRRSRRLICSRLGQRLISEIKDTLDTAMQTWLADIPADQLVAYQQTVEQLANRKTQEE